MTPRNATFPGLAAGVVLIGVLVGLAAGRAKGADKGDLFEGRIRPLLTQRCVECHGPKKQKGQLRLDVKGSALKGGEKGTVIVPGKAAESLLIRRVISMDEDERMPPKGERLSAAEIGALSEWIDGGAVWIETDADRAAARDSRKEHWAWQPVRAVRRPAAGRDGENPIDGFINEKLAAAGIVPLPEADARTLVRRLYFDLLGLPPTIEAVREFELEYVPRKKDAAVAALVEKLLASPHYGERWARHWLDIAHYADTHGFERDQRRDNAWRYRDWVIRALNADMPYDEFLRMQVAGDAIRPGEADGAVATGFLAAGPWDFVGQAETPSPMLKRLARADDLDDMVTQVMGAACGVTINCARCHDHKLDPILQREYYALTAVFAGVKRADRIVSSSEEKQIAQRRAELDGRMRGMRAALAKARGAGWSLADIVGGGDGLGSGKVGMGIDVKTGAAQETKRAFVEGVEVNRFTKSSVRFVDGVVAPDGGASGEVVVSSTGLKASRVPKTGGRVWDAIRNGPVNSPFSTVLGGVNYAAGGHTLLSLHANAAITFDLAGLKKAGMPPAARFMAIGGYFGQTPREGASIRVMLDAQTVFVREKIGRDDGPQAIDIAIGEAARFLTLMATDGGNDIGHDQICFGDAQLVPAVAAVPRDRDEIARLERQLSELEKSVMALPEPGRVYGIVVEPPPVVQVQYRGNPETPKEEVTPGAIACITGMRAEFGGNELSDGRRRVALANWITDPANPLTRRVVVNRLWHHHFGVGIVETPSDFGLGGGRPSHPELLDFLAEELLARKWSLKSMHQLLCTSAAYRRASAPISPNALKRDAGNRLVWRGPARRLDAESVHDAVLAVSGKLNTEMYGPGWRDFEYKEEYAPVYTYKTADAKELWRRGIYRFVVRTTPQQFMTTLDCPNPANLTPSRNVTTTALQSLALLNNDLVLRQAGYFADRVKKEAGAEPADQAARAIAIAFGRPARAEELKDASALIKSHGLAELCRMLLNANEFVYVD